MSTHRRMNWRRIYTAATPAERGEITSLLIRRIEARHRRLVFVRGWLIRERRRYPARYHRISNRRSQRRPSLLPLVHFALLALLVAVTLIANPRAGILMAALFGGFLSLGVSIGVSLRVALLARQSLD